MHGSRSWPWRGLADPLWQPSPASLAPERNGTDLVVVVDTLTIFLQATLSIHALFLLATASVWFALQ